MRRPCTQNWRRGDDVHLCHPSMLALAAAAIGLEDETIRHAREACEIGDPISIAVFSKSWRPYSARLRAYPRFCELFAGTGLE